MADLSHSDIYSLLEKALNKGKGLGSQSSWIRDVYPGYFIYRNPDAKLFKRTFSIDANQAVTLGEAVEVVQSTTFTPVTTAAFAFESEVTFAKKDAPMVIRSGKIFEAGDYELQTGNFSITEEELAEAAAEFSPVPVDLDHHPTILDGKLGQLRAVRVEGNALFGDVAIPTWLNDVLGDAAIKVSTTWDRAKKRIKKLALTSNPIISEAAVFSAFEAAFAGSTPVDYSPVNTQPKEKKKMGAKEVLLALLGRSTDDEAAEFAKALAGDTTPTPASGAPQPDPTVEDLKKRLADQEARFAKREEENRIKVVTATVDGLITAKKLFPAERATAIAAFAQAMADDESTGTLVTFSANGKEEKATRLAVLEAQYAVRPPHSLTTEQVAAFAVQAAATQPTADEKAAKENEELMSMTDGGRKALAEKKKS